MQWLIDIIAERVIAEIGIPPVFRDRGDGLTTDFETGDFIQDAAWHELDLSGIVDEGTTAVAVRLVGTSTAAGDQIRLRAFPDTKTPGRCCFRSQIANMKNNTNPVIPCSTDRKIEYQLASPNWTHLELSIRGWWL